MSVNEKLTAIADEIRYSAELGEGLLTLDDMARHITSVYNKGRVAGLIAENEEAYTTGYTNGYQDGVATASASGLLPAGVFALASGTYTCETAPTSSVEISHGLGIAPNFYIIFTERDVSCEDYNSFIIAQFGLKQSFTTSSQNGAAYRLLRIGGTNNFTTITTSTSVLSSFANDDSFFAHSSENYKFKPGITYCWIAGVVHSS